MSDVLDRCGHDLLRAEWRLCKYAYTIDSDGITYYTVNTAYYGPLSDFDKGKLKAAIDYQRKLAQDVKELVRFIISQVDGYTANYKEPQGLWDLQSSALRLCLALNDLEHDLGMFSMFEPTDWRPYRFRIFKR